MCGERKLKRPARNSVIVATELLKLLSPLLIHKSSRADPHEPFSHAYRFS